MGSQLDEAKIWERFRLSERELKKLRWAGADPHQRSGFAS